jgi:hypothetical protein
MAKPARYRCLASDRGHGPREALFRALALSLPRVRPGAGLAAMGCPSLPDQLSAAGGVEEGLVWQSERSGCHCKPSPTISRPQRLPTAAAHADAARAHFSLAAFHAAQATAKARDQMREPPKRRMRFEPPCSVPRMPLNRYKPASPQWATR